MTLGGMNKHRFQDHSLAVGIVGLLLLSVLLPSPLRPASGPDCGLWFLVCYPWPYIHWCPSCYLDCLNAYLFCLSYFPA